MSKTVIVGCKLPHGLIISINGTSIEINGRNESRIISNESYGTTEVDAELWAAWLEANKENRAVKIGAIFANSSEKSTKAEAKEKAKLKTGTEQIKAESKDGVEVV